MPGTVVAATPACFRTMLPVPPKIMVSFDFLAASKAFVYASPFLRYKIVMLFCFSAEAALVLTIVDNPDPIVGMFPRHSASSALLLVCIGQIDQVMIWPFPGCFPTDFAFFLTFFIVTGNKSKLVFLIPRFPALCAFAAIPLMSK